jgi:hypothetical protein
MRKENMMNTKMMRVTFAAVLMGGIAHAQTNWSWTFQRWGGTCGLLFESTNLTTSVKAAIRGDIAKAYTFTTTDNLDTGIYTPDDDEFGTFVGFDGLNGNRAGPAELGGWSYKLHNGNRYLYVKEDLSAKYLTQIALTNQHKAAVGSLSNFLATVNSTTANNLNPADYVRLWWSMEKGRSLTLADFKSEEEVRMFHGEFNGYLGEVIVPSILNFKKDAEMYGGVFYCKAVSRKRDDGTYEHGFPDIAYFKGKWYLVLPEF